MHLLSKFELTKFHQDNPKQLSDSPAIPPLQIGHKTLFPSEFKVNVLV